jgi:hypothetical protein
MIKRLLLSAALAGAMMLAPALMQHPLRHF